MEVAIIGYGWVGKAMHTLFPHALIYDPFIIQDGTINLVSKEEINKCDVAFICVPTDSVNAGILDISIVEDVVSWCESPLLVIRSTVNPGTTDYLSKKYNKHIVMQPEYLGETVNHPMSDQKTRQFLIIGGEKTYRRRLINLYTQVYNANTNIRQVTAYEAEVIKLSENRAIAFKIAECQELYDACMVAGVDYYTIREAVYSDDPRFNLWWSFVYPEKRGFNSKCLPKDVYAWAAWAESIGYQPEITHAILERNKTWI